jgi:membrane-bound serine protease (ClpP class)
VNAPRGAAAARPLAFLLLFLAGALLLLGAKPRDGGSEKRAAAKPAAETPAAGTPSKKEPAGPAVNVLTLTGAIQPISAQVIVQAIEHAERDDREALVIRIDTPGGLDTSMRDIIKRILVSEVPVVLYVAPSGARAASAGTFIAMAAHVAAMSPGTSIGAATPVQAGGAEISKDLAQKVKQDAASYIRSLAQQRGRNAEWAEKAVFEGKSINETEALKLRVIDVVAPTTDSLLAAIDGRKVTVAGIARTLRTKGAEQHAVEPSWRQELLSRIIDPNVAYILFILGFYGLLFELSNPGSILPGVVGGICILLAFLAFQALPVNLTGLFLILFAMVLFAVEVKVQSHGILGAGGVVALILGSMILLGGEGPAMRVSRTVIGTVVVTTVLFFMFVVGAAFRAQRRKVTTGWEGLVGERGVALTDLSPDGRVFVHGEYWEAEASEPVEKGAAVVVDRVDGMRLRVRRGQG